MTTNCTSIRGEAECDTIDHVFAMLEFGTDPLEQPVETDQHRVPWVLHIDDDEDFSWGVKTRLERHGIAVVRAFTGMDGYRAAFRHPADAILLDIEMPDGRGDYILRRLKESPATQHLPVFIISGQQDVNLRRTLVNLGAAAIFTKPVNYTALVNKLGEFITVCEKTTV